MERREFLNGYTRRQLAPYWWELGQELEVASGYRPWSNCPSCDGGQSGQLRLRDEFLCGTQEVLWVGVYQLRVVNGQSLSWNYSWFQSSPFRGQHVLGR